MFNDDNLTLFEFSVFAKALFQKFVPIFKCVFPTRWDVKDLSMGKKNKFQGQREKGTNDVVTKGRLTCLEGDVLPMNRVYGFDNGNSRLEFTPSSIEFTVEYDVLGKFWRKLVCVCVRVWKGSVYILKKKGRTVQEPVGRCEGVTKTADELFSVIVSTGKGEMIK